MPQPVKDKRENLEIFFFAYLNRIYYDKSFLIDHLPELAEIVIFGDLKDTIHKIIGNFGVQKMRMDKIYLLLGSKYVVENCADFIGLMDKDFADIKWQCKNAAFSDLSIMFYMQNTESMHMASCQMMELIVEKFGSKQIRQILKENFEDAITNNAKLLTVIERYLTVNNACSGEPAA